MALVDATAEVGKLLDAYRDATDLLRRVVKIYEWQHDEDHMARNAYESVAQEARLVLARRSSDK